jgi:hypothetical protein
MISAQEVRSVLRQFHQRTEPNAIAASFYAKLAIRSYYEAIIQSPHHDMSQNESAFEVSYEFSERAIQLGLPREAVDVPFFNLRRHWIPKLEQA